MKLYLNPNFFIKVISDNLILWDYSGHKQYTLKREYLIRIDEIINSKGQNIKKSDLDEILLLNNIISEEPYLSENKWEWDTLSHIFHYGTRSIPQEHDTKDGVAWANSYIEYCETLISKEFPKTPISKDIDKDIQLPNPELEKFDNSYNFFEILNNRKTSRNFFEDAIDYNDFSTLMYVSFGYLKERVSGISDNIPKYLKNRRSSPSGGGLNSCDIYLVALNIENVPKGIYFYNPDIHSLNFINEFPNNKTLGEFLSGQYFANNLSFGIFIVSRFDKLWWKYKHSRGYRVALLDAGHLSQTFQLSTTALGFQTWLTAAFDDSEVDNLLKISNSSAHPILFVGVGIGDGDPLDVEIKKILNNEE